MNLAQTLGPAEVTFELIEALSPGQRVLAKVTYYDEQADEMATGEEIVRVWDNVYKTTEGEVGDTGWGFVMLRRTETDYPLISLRGLNCTEG